MSNVSHNDSDLFVASTNIDSIVNEPTTKSHKIRSLYATGMSKGDISRLLNIRYQHVRNVLLQIPKKS